MPNLRPLEVGNVLWTGLLRKKHESTFLHASLDDLALLPIHVDLETNEHAWGAIIRLAERHQLTTCDAACLELASRLGLPLATLDKGRPSPNGIEGLGLLV